MLNLHTYLHSQHPTKTGSCCNKAGEFFNTNVSHPLDGLSDSHLKGCFHAHKAGSADLQAAVTIENDKENCLAPTHFCLGLFSNKACLTSTL